MAALLAVAALLALSLPSAALADTYSSVGSGADAMLDTYSETGAYSSGFLTAVDGTFTYIDAPRPDKEVFTGKSADFFMTQYIPNNPKTAKDDVYREIYAMSFPADFTAPDRTLGSATLSGILTGWIDEWVGVDPYSGPEWVAPSTSSEIVLSADVTWTGVGSLVRESSSYRYQESGFTARGRFSGTRRNAELSGSLVAPCGTDFLATAYPMATIFKSKSRDIMID